MLLTLYLLFPSNRPHYKPQHTDNGSSEDDTSEGKINFTNTFEWFKKENSNDSQQQQQQQTNNRVLNKSFSTQPTSRFRMHPYSQKRQQRQTFSSNNRIEKLSRSYSLNNQLHLNSSSLNAASLSTKSSVGDSQNWILRRSSTSRSDTNQQSYPNNNKRHSLSGNSRKNSLSSYVSPSRPASTAPASAIYQLNFPITTTKVPTTTTTANSAAKLNNTTAHNTNISNNNTILKTIVKSSTQSALQVSLNTTSVDNSIGRSQTPTQPGLASSIHTTITRHPLTTVQQKSLISTQQKIIPQSVVSSAVQQQGGSLLQVQPVLSNNVRTSNKINNLSKGLSINHTTAAVVSNGITTQPQSIQQLAR